MGAAASWVVAALFLFWGAMDEGRRDEGIAPYRDGGCGANNTMSHANHISEDRRAMRATTMESGGGENFLESLFLCIDFLGAGEYISGLLRKRGRGLWVIGYTSLQRFKNGIDGYFEECEKEERFPDEAGLILHLRLSVADYERRKGNTDGRSGEYSRLLEEARLKRESIIARELYSSGVKGTTGKIFLAKQAKNSGISEIDAEEGKLVIEVRMSGSGKGFFD